jgi:hypothetical protein
MGSTTFRGGSITKVLQFKQVELSHKLMITSIYKRIKDVTMITQDTNRYKKYKKIKVRSTHEPSMPQ